VRIRSFLADIILLYNVTAILIYLLMKELTKAEEQVMKYLWELKKAFLKDIVDKFPEPKPAYTTVQTVVSR
jgi:hypothetical protein